MLFASLFKIFCTYGLIKSPKGSNVVKGDVLKVLASSKASIAFQRNNKMQLLNGITEWIYDYGSSSPRLQSDADHTYGIADTDDRIISDVSGWVVREMIKRNECESCNLQLESFSSTTCVIS